MAKVKYYAKENSSIGTFSRHAKAETSFALVIWLNENVPIVEFSLA